MARFVLTTLLGGAVAAAIAAAPVAAADRGDTPGPSTNDSTSQSANPGNKFTPAQRGPNKGILSSTFTPEVPIGWKNEALWARPGAPGGSPFGSGPRPPVVGMD